MGFIHSWLLKTTNRIAFIQEVILWGKTILIKHVLQCTQIHCLSVINPLNNVFNQVQQMLDQFFWIIYIGGRGRHWSKWSTNLDLPEKEWGLGFRLMHDLSTTLFYKLWWSFKTKKTLCSKYMRIKYYRYKSPNLAMCEVGGGGSMFGRKGCQQETS